MKKKFLILTINIILIAPAHTKVLEGNVTYNVDTARIEAFNSIEETFPQVLIQKHFIDENYKTNKEALLIGNIELKDRIICQFSNGIYGVRYKKDPYRAYYYTQDGRLSYVDKKNRLEYPHNVSTYNLHGELIGTALYITKYEQYIFDLDKNLKTHWIGNNGYDAAGNKKWTRFYKE